MGNLEQKIDCHYCRYAWCTDENSEVDCYVDDDCYFDHHVTDAKEAETCGCFEYCDYFPKV